MADARAEAFAKLLVERCIDPEPGWQVMVLSSPLGRPVVSPVLRELARRRAYALLRLDFGMEPFPVPFDWALAAPDDLLQELAPIERYAVDHIDARIMVEAPENTRASVDVDAGRYGLIRRAVAPYYERSMSMQIRWVSTQFPTQALAQDAGMSLPEFEDFFYGAVLLDWDAEAEKMQRYADRLGPASEIRIVGEGTDLRIGIEGREAVVDDGRVNMPGGEFFFAPVEDSAEGVVTYSEFPAVLNGGQATGVRLRFEAGKIVDASAQSGEDFLLGTLDTDEGARRLGELGIGCNPGIQRHTKSILFDEKIDGTIHLAVGKSYEHAGGKNQSVIHWDMVKDLRRGGRLYADGELVQENGSWRL